MHGTMNVKKKNPYVMRILKMARKCTGCLQVLHSTFTFHTIYCELSTFTAMTALQ
jgi:hypothetical protein